MKKKLFYICLFLIYSCGNSIKIVDKPIVFNEKRTQLTQEYLSKRYGLEQDNPKIIPRMIVLHWTAIPTFQESFEAFNKPELSKRPNIASASSLNVSSHFLVDQDGTIYRLMSETIMARHVIGLNHTAIGIENVGGTSEVTLTQKQIDANVRLVKYLTKKYSIEYLIGHYEYIKFTNHKLWLEVDDNYRTKKTDPGEDFMKAVRKRVKKYNLKSTPVKKSIEYQDAKN